MQAQLDAAYDNFFELNAELVDDLGALLDRGEDSAPLRRAIIRAAAATMEAHAHALADICRVLQQACPIKLPESCQKVIDDSRMGSSKRIKHSLKTAYACFRLDGEPKFGVPEWRTTKDFLKRRDRLMHPKNGDDLRISDEEWEQIKAGFSWIFREYTQFQELLLAKYSDAR